MQPEGVLAPPTQSEVHCHTALPNHNCTVPPHQILRISATRRWCSSFVLCRSWELALDRHTDLQHLHLQNLVPQSVIVRSACRVHASYAGRLDIREIDARGDFATWAGYPLWNDVGPQLSSISVHDYYNTLGPFGIQEVGRCEGHIALRRHPAPTARLSLPGMRLIADLASRTQLPAVSARCVGTPEHVSAFERSKHIYWAVIWVDNHIALN